MAHFFFYLSFFSVSYDRFDDLVGRLEALVDYLLGLLLVFFISDFLA